MCVYKHIHTHTHTQDWEELLEGTIRGQYSSALTVHLEAMSRLTGAFERILKPLATALDPGQWPKVMVPEAQTNESRRKGSQYTGSEGGHTPVKAIAKETLPAAIHGNVEAEVTAEGSTPAGHPNGQGPEEVLELSSPDMSPADMLKKQQAPGPQLTFKLNGENLVSISLRRMLYVKHWFCLVNV